MTETEQASQTEDTPPRRRWVLRGAAILLALLAVGIAVLTERLVSGPVDLPRPVVRYLEEKASNAMAPARMRLSGAELRLDRQEGLNVALRDVVLRDAGGTVLGQLTRARAVLSPRDLLRGEIAPTVLGIDGAQLTMRRSSTGAFTLDFGAGGSGPQTPAEVLDAVRGALSLPGLGRVEEVTGTDLTIALEDARSGRVWQATGGRFTAQRTTDALELDVFSEVFNGTETLATLQSSLSVPLEPGPSQLAITLANASSRDLSLQSPVLSYLSVLDALVSGAIRAEITPGGGLASLAATLEIGAGALEPDGAAKPVRFNSARAYMTYDPSRERIEFTEISVQSDVVSAVGEGHAYLRDVTGGWPETLLAQIRLAKLQVAPDGVFETPLSFDGGQADFRVRLAPFDVTFGQVVLGQGEDRLRAKAKVTVGEGGWHVAADLAAARATPERVLGLWPVDAARGARIWLTRNLKGALLEDISLALRIGADEAEPEIGASFDFRDAEVQFMPHMPPVTGGAGHAALTGRRFALAVTEGQVAEPGHGALDMRGTTFVVPDVFLKRAVGEVGLVAAGALKDAMAVLENRPLRLLTKTGRPPGFVDGIGRAEARITVPLLKDLKVEDVDFGVDAMLTEITSGQIVTGRRLSAEALRLTAIPSGMEIAGRVRVDDIPADILLDQPFSRGAAAELVADVGVDARVLAELGVVLPEGALSGETRARVSLDLPEDAPPTFRVSGDLGPLRLSVPALGWSKPAGAEGTLELLGRLGQPIAIDRIAAEAAGLSAEGRIQLSEEGGFEAVDLDLVRLGNWLEAPVRITPGAGGGPPRIALGGGRVDLRRRPSGPAGSGSGPPVPMDIRLDRLVVNDAISLTGLRAEVLAGRALQGRFTGRMNGGSEIMGDLLPQPAGTALRIRGADAGSVLRDAGLFKSLDDGAFEVVMVPRQGGGMDGQLRIEDARLGDQPILADLLDAVSVVGIIDQLRGPGILFDQIDGTFRLEGDRLVLEQSSAIGASLGVSLDGVYDTRTKQLDMGGVISPVYLLNSVGSIFTRRGEGLFGFTFRLTGNAQNPRMAVNPLSILTPGMFREIFRRAPPERQ